MEFEIWNFELWTPSELEFELNFVPKIIGIEIKNFDFNDFRMGAHSYIFLVFCPFCPYFFWLPFVICVIGCLSFWFIPIFSCITSWLKRWSQIIKWCELHFIRSGWAVSTKSFAMVMPILFSYSVLGVLCHFCCYYL